MSKCVCGGHMVPYVEPGGFRDPNVHIWVCEDCGRELELDMTPEAEADGY